MIKKITLSLILLCLFIAIPLAVLGIKKVDIGTDFMWFIQRVDKDFSTWKVNIPKIPIIAYWENNSGWYIVLNFLITVWDFIVGIFNTFITIINILIQVIQFICTLLFDLGVFVGQLIVNGDYEYQWPWQFVEAVLYEKPHASFLGAGIS